MSRYIISVFPIFLSQIVNAMVFISYLIVSLWCVAPHCLDSASPGLGCTYSGRADRTTT